MRTGSLAVCGPIIRPNAHSSKKEYGNLILRIDIPVQTKLFVSADTQRKVCMSVGNMVLFLVKSSEGDRQKESVQGEKKKQYLNQMGVSL